MSIDVKKLDSERYFEATELGSGLLFDFENYRFIEGTDEKDKARYIIVENRSQKTLDEVVPGLDEVSIIEAQLLDFHNLCTLYIMSLQDGCKAQATPLLKRDLENIFKAF